MAKLPHTSQTAIAISFLVINLSALLRQLFLSFFVFKTKQHFFGRAIINSSYELRNCQH
jgi:hypothetical protein